MYSSRIKNIFSTSVIILGFGFAAILLYIYSLAANATGNTYSVVNTNDSGAGSLRQAIVDANSSPGADMISFNIAGSGPHTIDLESQLTITDEVVIDGYSQPGAVANTAISPQPFNGSLQIEIDGSLTPYDPQVWGGFCLKIQGADDVTIQGLVINDCARSGIVVAESERAVIQGNYIGTDVSGTIDKGAGRDVTGAAAGHGILAHSSKDLLIGGALPSERNVIAGNQAGEIHIENERLLELKPSENNTIQGNYIGVGADGTTGLPSGWTYGIGNAILLGNTHDDQIGGPNSGEMNVIGSSYEYGVAFREGTSGTRIQGNYIGTDYTGTTALTHALGSGHISAGVHVGTVTNAGFTLPVKDVLVGGPTKQHGNVISGNSYAQAQNKWFYSPGFAINDGGSEYTVQNNLIGVGADGVTAVPNQGDGVYAGEQAENGIVKDNVVSANGGVGVVIDDTNNTIVEGNLVGVAEDGTTALGNQTGGIWVKGLSDHNLIWYNTVAHNNANLDFSGGIHAFKNPGGTPSANTFLYNELYNNNGLGIDLSEDVNGYDYPSIDIGVRTNDANDTDIGANGYINYPEINSAYSLSGKLYPTYSLDVDESALNGYLVEFYASSTTDVSGHGEGRIPIGTDVVAGDVTNRKATITLPANFEFGEYYISATTTEIDGSVNGYGATSEFSGNLLVDLTNESEIQVNSTADDTADDGECTLREAIIAANDNQPSGASEGECASGAADDTITFNIDGTDVKTITLEDNLPIITDKLTVNGYTQAGATPNTKPAPEPFDTQLKIEIDGSELNPGQHCFELSSADDVTISGLVINLCPNEAIRVEQSNNFTLTGNFIGTDVTGNVKLGNGWDCTCSSKGQGMMIVASSGAQIGGTNPVERNVIAGNDADEIFITNPDDIAPSKDHVVQGNYLGLAADGVTHFSYGHIGYGNGIRLGNTFDTVIGGNTPDAMNVISGNNEFGISMVDGTNNITIHGNRIGTDWSGSVAVPNDSIGISISSWAGVGQERSPHHITIGGAGAGEGNLISGNGEHNSGPGIMIGKSVNNVDIMGNIIGMDKDAVAAIPNVNDGIQIRDNTHDINIGGVAPGEGNVISANNWSGIKIRNNANNINIAGNTIDSNSHNGIQAGDTTQDIAIGTGNTISGSGWNGIMLQDDATLVSITGNTITQNPSGINISGYVSETTIGGSAADANDISDNTWNGIMLGGNSSLSAVIGNTINNNSDGIRVSGSSNNNTIGGLAIAEGNTLQNNTWNGIKLEGSAANNVISFNAVSGSYTGISLAANAIQNEIGISNAGNWIHGNTHAGVKLDGNTGLLEFNKIVGNKIGLTSSGSADGNGTGVIVLGHAQNSVIGGVNPGEQNTIVSNLGNGGFAAGISIVKTANGTPTSISTLGNVIHSNNGIAIDIAEDTNGDNIPDTRSGADSNDTDDADAGPNNYLNSPVIASVESVDDTLEITYSLDVDEAATGYRIEFFASSGAISTGAETFVGAADVTGDVSSATAVFNLPSGLVSGQYSVGAIATENDASADGYGASSELGQTVSGVLDGAISGTVTQDGTGVPLAGVVVAAVGPFPQSADLAGSAYTDSNGNYNIEGLEGGDYLLVFIDPTLGHAIEYFDDAPDANTSIFVAPSVGSVVQYDASLAPQTPPQPGSSSITGTITADDGGSPLQDIFVLAIGNDIEAITLSDALGNYTLNLDPGEYRIEYIDFSGIYRGEWYNDVPLWDINNAAPVDLTPAGLVLDVGLGAF